METAPKERALPDNASGQTLASQVPHADAQAAPVRRRATRLSPDRRRYHRVNVRLLGRFMRANQQEYPCQVINMSPGDSAMLAPVSGELGERIVIYVDHIGRIEGEVMRTFQGGFAVRIHATQYKREKIANQLTWIINRDRLNLAEDRHYERLVPKNPFTTLVLADGTDHHCRVLDVSLSGASIAINPKPPIDSTVTLGLMRGRVMRHHEQGIGIQFLDIQDMAAIRRHFG